MTALPAFTAHKVYSHNWELTPEQRFSRAIIATFRYYVLCWLLTFLLAELLATPISDFSFPHSPHPYFGALFAHKAWIWRWILAAAWLAGLFMPGYVLNLGLKKFQTHPMATALFTGLCVLALLFVNLSAMGRGSPFNITLWLFLIGVWSAMMRDNYQKRDEMDHLMPIVIGILALSSLAKWVYPLVKPSWGGGGPVQVVVYFANDSRLLPGQSVGANLLDESDGGFYIVESDQTRAIFIPRSSVASMYFSDKPLNLNNLNPQPTPQRQVACNRATFIKSLEISLEALFRLLRSHPLGWGAGCAGEPAPIQSRSVIHSAAWPSDAASRRVARARSKNIPRARAQRHADAHPMRSLRHGISDHAVEADARERGRWFSIRQLRRLGHICQSV